MAVARKIDKSRNVLHEIYVIAAIVNFLNEIICS